MAEGQIPVHLVTRASRNQLVGIRGGVLRARVTAPPVDGKANKALCRLVAKRLGIAPSNVHVIRGLSSRNKVLSVKGLGKAALERVLRDGER